MNPCAVGGARTRVAVLGRVGAALGHLHSAAILLQTVIQQLLYQRHSVLRQLLLEEHRVEGDLRLQLQVRLRVQHRVQDFAQGGLELLGHLIRTLCQTSFVQFDVESVGLVLQDQSQLDVVHSRCDGAIRGTVAATVTSRPT